MKVMLSGASGFIGRHLLGMSLQDVEFHVLDRDHGGYPAQINESRPDVFLHLAGISSNAECEANIGKAFQVNVALACEMFEEFCRVNPNGHFIFFSTGQVYDFSNEDVITENASLKPQSLYAQTKLCAEAALQNLARFRTTRLTIVRLFNTSHKTQDLRFFLPSIYQQMLDAPGDAVDLVVGNIDVKRDFSSIHDTVEKLLKLIRGQLPNVGIINFCSGNSYSLRDLATQLGKDLGKTVRFQVDPRRVRLDEVPEVRVGSDFIEARKIEVEEFLAKWRQ